MVVAEEGDRGDATVSCRRPQHREQCALAMDAVATLTIGLTIGVGADDIALLVAGRRVDLYRQLALDERQRRAGQDVAPVIIARNRPQLECRIEEIRFLADIFERADRRLAAIERPLRPAQ